jgi:hypothetical protein
MALILGTKRKKERKVRLGTSRVYLNKNLNKENFRIVVNCSRLSGGPVHSVLSAVYWLLVEATARLTDTGTWNHMNMKIIGDLMIMVLWGKIWHCFDIYDPIFRRENSKVKSNNIVPTLFLDVSRLVLYSVMVHVTPFLDVRFR